MQRKQQLGWLLASVAALGSAGCTTPGGIFPGGIFQSAEVVPPTGPEAAAQEAAGKFSVEIRPENGKPQVAERPLTGQMHVQEGLEQTGAHRKFRRNHLELVRKLPNGGVHRIPLEWDSSNRRVAVEFDYALLPGDRIVVREDTTTFVDDMLGTALGPLGSSAAKNVRKGFLGDGGRYHVGD